MAMCAALSSNIIVVEGVKTLSYRAKERPHAQKHKYTDKRLTIMRPIEFKSVFELVCACTIIASLITYALSNLYMTGERYTRESWISPADHYLPLAFRVNSQGLIYYDPPYIVIRVHNESDQWSSWLAFGEIFDFGIYEWKAKCENNVSNAHIYLGIFEHHHGWSDEGIITIRYDGVVAKWQFYTSNEVGEKKITIINDVNFSMENTLKIDWAPSHVSFYVNDTLKATHTTAVPQEAMQLFAEVGTGPSPPLCEPKCLFREGSFREISD